MNLLVDQGPFALFAALVFAHVLADFPLQGEYLATQKVRSQANSDSEWIVALSAHAIIHAGVVWLATGSLLLGMVELVLHGLIDFGKGERKFGFLTDQLLHILCKVGYVIFLVFA